jgi:hypothetical protein
MYVYIYNLITMLHVAQSQMCSTIHNPLILIKIRAEVMSPTKIKNNGAVFYLTPSVISSPSRYSIPSPF